MGFTGIGGWLCYGFWIYLYFCFGCMLLLVPGMFGYAGCLGWVGFVGVVGFKRDFVVCGLLVLVWVFVFELVGFGLAGCIVCGWLRELWLCCWVWVGVSGLILYVVGVCVSMVVRSDCLFYCWYC